MENVFDYMIMFGIGIFIGCGICCWLPIEVKKKRILNKVLGILTLLSMIIFLIGVIGMGC